MKKQDFTIEGTEALKRAFIRDSGLEKGNLSHKYLTNSTCIKGFVSTPFPKNKHFILPQDWDEAMEYVSDFWEKPKFHLGDYVFIEITDHDAVRVNKKTAIVTNQKPTCGHESGFRVLIHKEVWGLSRRCKIRYATKEEIEEYKK